MIIAKVEENGKKTEQRHYFIYSCKNMTAQQIMRAKRAHWSVENSLHWVLDIAFREDESRARKGDSAENFNILRQIAMNVLKLDTSFKESIPNKQFRCLLDSAYLDILLIFGFVHSFFTEEIAVAAGKLGLAFSKKICYNNRDHQRREVWSWEH
ncbi:MAG: ISAs1 family transposase, partial [Ruminococcus sp.]|nr:ISAs1 family transposase [Ruminococcus sp.]